MASDWNPPVVGSTTITVRPLEDVLLHPAHKAEVAALRSRLAEAERLLSALKRRNMGSCPWCGGYVDHIPGKCEADCSLARWLEGGGR